MSRAVKIDVTRFSVSEGMMARNAEKPFTACPCDSFTEQGRVEKAHWLYGWRFRDDALKADAKIKRDANGRGVWKD